MAGVITNTVFAFIYAAVFEAVHDTAGTIGGVSAAETVTYVFVAQGFLMMTGAFGDPEISERIKTGDIAADLYRPVDFQLWWLAHDLGKGAFHLLGRGVPPVLVGVVALSISLPTDPGATALFAVATLNGMILAFGLRFLANLTGFWLLDARGIVTLGVIAQSFLAGHIVPLYFLPEPLQTIVRLTPFAGITAHPVEIWLGVHDGPTVAALIGGQVVWIVVLLGAGRLVLGAARRRLVIQGG